MLKKNNRKFEIFEVYFMPVSLEAHRAGIMFWHIEIADD